MTHQIHEIIWGPWLLLAFLGVGIYYTVKTGFFQIRKIRYWMGETAGSIGKTEEEHKGVSQFQSSCTALAATIGTGNIVGVATALTAGGAGAIFWMWVSAVIGMMTAYAETYLGIHYRYRKKDGSYLCGPMVYLDRGLNRPVLAMIYGFCCIMTALGMGSMVQANSLSETAGYSFGISPLVAGAAATIAVFLIIKGGIRRIAAASEKIMPVSAGIYFFFSMAVILSCVSKLPDVFAEIFRSAFEPAAVFGGTAGFCISRSIQYGISRGVFSNEAGLGTLAVLHGAAENTTPEKQGMWAMFEVFVDTIVICTLTALVILLMTDGKPETAGIDGAALTAWCFSKRMGKAGEYLVSLSMTVFAFATIIAWYYLGKQAVSYLAEHLHIGWKIADVLYTVLYLNAVFLGCLSSLEAVWEFADIWNGLLAIPNLFALVALRKVVMGLER
ncbi:sodium:alanine symporter family protein [Clostridium sp. AM58-1XD]|uniref:alanine/glycine:cation symporter family protein n=1 Tax=Clostridium sp. AM58-1XD TaxID=2292307 RepID=UPI000E4ABFD1|nr:sodium:alanine symporter family protein [Clostridium sp. AM58-1XD]RGY98905.1 sodium:alanine symporter family protein [Clostridium sp. AM58-1XD]